MLVEVTDWFTFSSLPFIISSLLLFLQHVSLSSFIALFLPLISLFLRSLSLYLFFLDLYLLFLSSISLNLYHRHLYSSFFELSLSLPRPVIKASLYYLSLYIKEPVSISCILICRHLSFPSVNNHYLYTFFYPSIVLSSRYLNNFKGDRPSLIYGSILISFSPLPISYLSL